MNASNPEHTPSRVSMRCQPVAHPHCNWHRAGTKPLTSTSQGTFVCRCRSGLAQRPDEQLRSHASARRRAVGPVRLGGVALPSDLRKQRVLQMAAGYEDANDANAAPRSHLHCASLPETGAPLASQPTLSRCENRVSRTALSPHGAGVGGSFLASYRHPPGHRARCR